MDSTGSNGGMRFVELNGDGRVDLVYHRWDGQQRRERGVSEYGDGVAKYVGIDPAAVYRGQHGVG